MAMVRPSTQQTVDRILGTAAVISISVALVRWLSSQSSHTLRRQDRKECAENDNNNASRWRWWRLCIWPVGATALQGKWNDNRKQNRMKSEQNSDTRKYEHSGSCHCGSIHFLVSFDRERFMTTVLMHIFNETTSNLRDDDMLQYYS
jgi:hypothetical protein